MIKVEIYHVVFERAPRHVATLTSESAIEDALEEAFEGTQNITSSWVDDRGQNGVRIVPTDEVLRAKPRCRSTSVGDYACVVDSDGIASFWRCHSANWSPIRSREELDQVGQKVMLAAYGALL